VRNRTNRLGVIALAALLGACGGKPRLPDDDAPTLKALVGRSVDVPADAGIASNEQKAMAAYRDFLAAAPNLPTWRAEALRRLGDLEMDAADRRSAADTAAAAPDYRAAIARYRDFLATYPNDPGNDRVLYQLARAHEQGGELEPALRTLDRLVQAFPQTAQRDEAQFRRGELLFATRRYGDAERAYASVLGSDREHGLRQRALYMQGWSRFKQGRLDEALHSFFGVLDVQLAQSGDAPLEQAGLSRAERELVEDTFRVVGLSLAHLQGAESIAAYIDSDARRAYEFRVYEQLGELYLKQERPKDAADAFAAFARTRALHAQAPLLQTRVIGIYEQAGFGTLALQAKREYVERYGARSEFRRANPQGWQRAQPLVKSHLAELARHHHAGAQKTRSEADVHEAVRWYREIVEAFADDPATAQQNFLLAELLFEQRRHGEAALEYERTAYAYPPHAKSADAGYAALLAHAQDGKRSGSADVQARRQAGIDSALRFAGAFDVDARVAPVLADTAESLYALGRADAAVEVAQRLLARAPAAAPAQRKVAWTVVAHAAFDAAAFERAERAYAEVLALTPERDPARAGLVERQAAAIYKQGEQARAAGDARTAVAHFERVAVAAPQSAVRAHAQYDAAAASIGLKDWAVAVRGLEDFRQRYPQHALQGEVAGKLAAAYLEQGDWARAAGELERVAAGGDATLAREALWQAAELHEKAGARAPAAKAYERWLKANAEPFERSVEARWRLARIAKADGQGARELALLKEIHGADAAGGAARTERTRALGASAALALAEPAGEAYRQVALVEPLARQLKLKKARMEDALKAYGVAAGYGVAEVTTAATFHTAALYHDFGRALLGSQRPKKLSKAEREQYDVLLEEQAFPFEEKAAELHELNARRSADGVYDTWVQRSYAALRDLQPVRFGKRERGDDAADAATQAGVAHRDAGRLDDAVAAFESALRAQPKQAALYNQLGITQRQRGRFEQARAAYEQAIALDPAYAAPQLNLGILHDLYRWDAARALECYDRYLALAPGGDGAVSKWVAELRNRKPAPVAMSGKERS
jgi:tetratricopeptide (TPR) repeat protein